MACLITVVSCSKTSTDEDGEEDGADVEMSDAGEAEDGEASEESLDGEGGEEVVADGEEAPADGEASEDTVALDSGSQDLEEVPAPTDSATEDYTAEQPSGAAVADASASSDASMPATTDTSGIGDGEYVVKSNETMMLIAFNLYGDYSRWKEIASLNQDQLKGSTMISPGMRLRINNSGSGFNWSRDGKDYTIVRGDTLSLISNRFYGTLFKWKKIWENNKPLIKDPNKIFVGFTIYVPDATREMASEPAAPSAPVAPEQAAPATGDQMATGAGDFPADI